MLFGAHAEAALTISELRLPELHPTASSHSDDEVFLSVELKHMRSMRRPEMSFRVRAISKPRPMKRYFRAVLRFGFTSES
jgi:hypothetical protein